MHSNLKGLYFLTFGSVVCFNILMCSIGFIKEDLQREFRISILQLGIADAVHSITAVIGVAIFVFAPSMVSNIYEVFIFNFIIHSLGFLLLPLGVVLQIKSAWVVYAAQFIFGLSNSIQWPSNLLIINEYREKYKPEPEDSDESQRIDKFMLSVWGVGPYVGLIATSVSYRYLTMTLGIDWTRILVAMCFLQIMASVSVYIFLKIKQSQQNPEDEIIAAEEQTSMEERVYVWSFLCCFYRSRNRICISIIYLCMRTVAFQFIFSLPFYLNLIGFAQQQGKMACAFYLCVILSSFLMGWIDWCLQRLYISVYKSELRILGNETSTLNQSQQKKILYISNSIMLFLLLLTLIIGILYQNLWRSEASDQLANLVVIGLIGLFLGGPNICAYTSMLLELAKDTSLISSIRSDERLRLHSSFESVLHKDEEDVSDSQMQNSGESNWLWVSLPFCILGFLQSTFQLFSIFQFMAVSRMLSLDPNLYLTAIAVPVLVCFVTDVFRNFNIWKVKDSAQAID